jgi:uncharacterized protein (TIGR01777 family)
MQVLMSGASGLLGTAIGRALQAEGAVVTQLVRRGGSSGRHQIPWEPGKTLNLSSNFDAVVHLAGESVMGRWTAAKRARVRDSRVLGTGTIAEAIERMEIKPRVLVAASAIGYYGDGGDELLNEESASGTGFLAEVCREWEAAADPARRAGIRVVHLRTGVVLSDHGGALGAMVSVFRLGLGGKLGSGRQWWSWIHLDDVAGAVQHILREDAVLGPVNLVAPNPVTNAEFTAILGRVLSRPVILSVPEFALRLAMGEMAEEVLLASQRVEPRQLVASGYRFQFHDLNAALLNLLPSRTAQTI